MSHAGLLPLLAIAGALGGFNGGFNGRLRPQKKQYGTPVGAPPREERPKLGRSPTGRNGPCSCGSGRKAKKCCH